MKTRMELTAVRMAMSQDTKRQFRDGVDTMAQAAVYLKALEQMNIVPHSLFEKYADFAALLTLIGEGVEHDDT